METPKEKRLLKIKGRKGSQENVFLLLCPAPPWRLIFSASVEIGKSRLDVFADMPTISFLVLKQLAKSSILEHRIAMMKQEQKSWEHQSETLKSQLVASQEKVCG